MASNWPPTDPYPSWLSFSTLQGAALYFAEHGFTLENPTAQENQSYFKQVRCDHGDPCSGLMLVSPGGLRYPVAYCTGATHKSALMLWVVGYDAQGQPCYDLGWGSGL